MFASTWFPGRSAPIDAPRHASPSRRRRAGQSILEATIAAGIVATAVSSALTLTQASVNAETESQAGIVAANFAREGFEVVRSIRDSNWLKDQEWDTGLTGENDDHTAIAVFDPVAGAWTLDFQPNDVTELVTRFYRYTTGDDVGLMVQAMEQPPNTIPLMFMRLLIIDPICPNGDVKGSGLSCTEDNIGFRVISRVRWVTAGRTHVMDITGDIYDWR